VVGSDGGKRLYKIRQTSEEGQRADFWNPPLDQDSPCEQAVPNAKVSRPVVQYLLAEYKVGKIAATRALDDLLRFQLYPIFRFQKVFVNRDLKYLGWNIPLK